MQINESNKKLYEDAFISNGEYGDFNNWKPSIDERKIEEWSEDKNGIYKPATPLGYRDYTLSRKEGLMKIFNQEPSADFTYEEAHEMKKGNDSIKQYDKIKIDGTDYVVTGDDEEKYYIISEEGKAFYINYFDYEMAKKTKAGIE